MNKEREIKVVRQMIQIYCKKKHGSKRKQLCEDCSKLMDYVVLRREKCPFGDEKTFCAHCKIHCYKKDMREEIRQVMWFSGPRMIFYNPVMTFRHVVDSRKEQRKIRREGKSNEK